MGSVHVAAAEAAQKAATMAAAAAWEGPDDTSDVQQVNRFRAPGKSKTLVSSVCSDGRHGFAPRQEPPVSQDLISSASALPPLQLWKCVCIHLHLRRK
jgi:hypothetical protein